MSAEPERRACLVSRENLADKQYSGDGSAGSSTGAGSNPIRILASALQPGLRPDDIEVRLKKGDTVQVGKHYLRNIYEMQELTENIRRTQMINAGADGKVANLSDLRGGDTAMDGDLSSVVRNADRKAVMDLYDRLQRGDENEDDKIIFPPTERIIEGLSKQLCDEGDAKDIYTDTTLQTPVVFPRESLLFQDSYGPIHTHTKYGQERHRVFRVV